MSTAKENIKPTLYRGQPLPLSSLSPDSFEDFIYQALVKLGIHKGFEVIVGRQPSGDQGYDCTARDITNNSIICIQCKRYNDSLLTKTVIEEIIKVAFDGAINGSTPSAHYIITSGSVSNKLREQLRQYNLLDIKAQCIQLINDSKTKNATLKNALEKGINLEKITIEYLDNLILNSKLVIWSGVDFENQLSTIWSELTDIIEKNFSVHIALKEHPRPDFNLENYIKKKKEHKCNLIKLHYKFATLPTNLISLKKIYTPSENSTITTNDIIESLKIGKNIVLSSDGGSGKSSTLSILEGLLLEKYSDYECIPVKINLRNYSRGTLKEKINNTLGINYGSWKSLPLKFIFLFDAIDEMLETDTQAFIDELELLEIKNGIILSLRNTGLNIPTSVNFIDTCIEIKPLSYRSAFDIAKTKFNDDDLKIFYSEYRDKLSNFGLNFLTLPLFLSIALERFKLNKKLPNSVDELLESWVSAKLRIDQGKVKISDTKINKIDKNLAITIISLMTYNFKIGSGLSRVSEQDYFEVLSKSYNQLSLTHPIILGYLNFGDFSSIVGQYEVFIRGEDGFYSMPHMIISDYLISKIFAKKWKEQLSYFSNNLNHDIWIFSAYNIVEEEKKDYLEHVLSFNLILGAKIAKNFGGYYFTIAEKVLLENEKSLKVLVRSEAIIALGILGSTEGVARLQSNQFLIDNHHEGQRINSLALNGHKETLQSILLENEQMVQTPATVTGGRYNIWFMSPPSIITDIARARLSEWMYDKNTPLCMSLETLFLYGDIYDNDLLVEIIRKTKHKKEFHLACKALNATSQNILIETLKENIQRNHHFSSYSREILNEIGVEVSFEDEFNTLVELTKLEESKLVDLILYVEELVKLIKKGTLSDLQAELLALTYKSLAFKKEFYFYYQIWSLASFFKLHTFFPIIEEIFINEDSVDINHAMSFLVTLEHGQIPISIMNLVENYEDKIAPENIGIKRYYASYYLMKSEEQKAANIINSLLFTKLNVLDFSNINTNDYMLNINFGLSSILKDAIIVKHLIDKTAISKLLLVNFSMTKEADELKAVLIKLISVEEINECLSLIKNKEIKIYVLTFLLEYNCLNVPLDELAQFLAPLMSHHYFFPKLLIISRRLWSDEFAEIFLKSFHITEWNYVTAQLFEEYTGSYSDLFTEQQLRKYDDNKEKPINIHVERIYSIWLESKGI